MLKCIGAFVYKTEIKTLRVFFFKGILEYLNRAFHFSVEFPIFVI